MIQNCCIRNFKQAILVLSSVSLGSLWYSIYDNEIFIITQIRLQYGNTARSYRKKSTPRPCTVPSSPNTFANKVQLTNHRSIHNSSTSNARARKFQLKIRTSPSPPGPINRPRTYPPGLYTTAAQPTTNRYEPPREKGPFRLDAKGAKRPRGIISGCMRRA